MSPETPASNEEGGKPCSWDHLDSVIPSQASLSLSPSYLMRSLFTKVYCVTSCSLAQINALAFYPQNGNLGTWTSSTLFEVPRIDISLIN